ncbi:protein kinase superfamily [Sarracenia purpurea var. burkii]
MVDLKSKSETKTQFTAALEFQVLTSQPKPTPRLAHQWLTLHFHRRFMQELQSIVDILNYAQLKVDFSAVLSFLLNLPRLEFLSLKGANLSGSVASSGARTTQCSAVLEAVDLAENGLSGPLSDLSTFVHCSSLSSLNLSKNFLDFNLLLKDYSSGLRLKLGVLDLSYNKISGHDVVPWLLSGGCGDLRYLSLRGNKVSGGIPVLDCGALEYLDLSANNFTSGFPSFRDCSSLQHLDLSSNKFSGDAGASLSTCKSITFLNLTNNQLTGAVPSIPGDGMQFLYSPATISTAR